MLLNLWSARVEWPLEAWCSKSRWIKGIRKGHKHDNIIFCFSIKCSKKRWALKCKQEVGRQQSSLTLAVDRSEWTTVSPVYPKQDAGSAPELIWTFQEDKNFWLLPGIKPQFLSPTTSNYLLNNRDAQPRELDMIFTAVKNSISYNSTIV